MKTKYAHIEVCFYHLQSVVFEHAVYSTPTSLSIVECSVFLLAIYKCMASSLLIVGVGTWLLHGLYVVPTWFLLGLHNVSFQYFP